LVVGDGFVASDLRSGRLTGKARRVLELHERGQAIEVLSEGEFLQMVGHGDIPAGLQAGAGGTWGRARTPAVSA